MHSPESRETLVRAALHAELFDQDENPVASVIDLDHLAHNVAELHRAFPQDLDVLHAFAVKANSVVPVLRELRELGLGAEAASHGELTRALEAGHEPEKIVFDSPAKSRGELRRAIELDVALNIDNFQELARIVEISKELGRAPRAGFRINPQVGRGSIAAMSTAGQHSKFGLPLRDLGMREQIINAYLDLPWLSRVHAHVGSQGCPLELIAKGVAAAIELADEVNVRAGRAQIHTIDIGGGLPVDFTSDARVSNFTDYVAALAEDAPRLFSGDYRVVTEFGRSVLAKSGMLLSHVEYTKSVGGREIAITHIGAQVATRTVFMPEAWPLRVEAYDRDGRAKLGQAVATQDIAGPCCFAGDLVAANRELPLLHQGDVVAVLDTGAYYASTPFDYNSLPLPGMFGVRGLSRSAANASAVSNADVGVEFSVLRAPSRGW